MSSVRCRCPWLASTFLMSVWACSDGTAGPGDGDGNSDAGDADGNDEGPVDADAESSADAVTCPDVTATHEILSSETITNVRVSLRMSDQEVALNLCRWTPALPWAEKLGEAAGCRLLHEILPTTETPENLDTGDVTIEINGAATPFEDAATGMPCYRLPTAALAEIQEGDTVRVWSTGGTDLPGFDLTAVVPARPAVVEPADGGAYVRCAPWRVSWTPAPPPNARLTVVGQLDGRQLYVSCQDLPASPQDISPELTALWPAAVPHAEVYLATEATAVSGGDSAVTLRITSYAELAGPRVDIADPAP